MRTELVCAGLLGTAVLALGCTPKQDVASPAEPAFATSPPMLGPTSSRESASAPALTAPYEVGLASWYGNAFRGKRTSSGERFDPGLFTAAHKKLPFGTWVDVTRSDTGRTVRVRINDRGPNGRAAHRIIDLSQRAAEDLDVVRAGVVRVELRIVRAP